MNGALPQDELDQDVDTTPNKLLVELDADAETPVYDSYSPEYIAGYDRGRRDEASNWATAIRVSLLQANVPAEDVEPIVDKIRRRKQ